MEDILELDKSLFLWLNSFHTPFLDRFFLEFTKTRSWIPVVLILLFLLIRNLPLKRALIYLILIAAAIGLCDYLASGIIKPFFSRLRPCHNYLDEMFLVGNCGGKYGFVSSHAANSFAIFSGFSIALKHNKYVFWLLLFWAILMSYSRIYLGLHSPSDIFFGALIGLFVPQVILYLFSKLNIKNV